MCNSGFSSVSLLNILQASLADEHASKAALTKRANAAARICQTRSPSEACAPNTEGNFLKFSFFLGLPPLPSLQSVNAD
jgi:hypothetical protein